MLDNTITVDLGADLGIVLTRVNQDNFSSQYFGEGSANEKITLNVKHDIPSRGAAGESHLVRLDVEHYGIDGAYLSTSSAWVVIKTFDGIQVSQSSVDTQTGLAGILAPAFVAKIVARES